MTDFHSLGITAPVHTYLYEQGIRVPTDIQVQAIPAIFRGQDILAHSRTGTGKTLAFLLPLLQRIRRDENKEQALILTPTREIARQIYEVARPLGTLYGVDIVVLTGGATLENQLQKLQRRPHVVIGTPGRILDHHQRHEDKGDSGSALHLSSVRTVVLDEADQMLAMGFLGEVRACIDATAKSRQLLLFSATLPVEIRKLARSYMKQPLSLNADGGSIVLDEIEQRIYTVSEEKKTALLIEHLQSMNPYLAIVFTNTKERAQSLMYELAQTGLNVEGIHGDMSQSARNRVLREFAKGRFPILVASDIAARGIDIEGVSHVFNYDVPSDTDYYIHRIGRTGRAGRTGLACTYATPHDAARLRRIEARIEQPLLKYDRDGNVKVKKPSPKRKKKVLLPGQYAPTKEKAHKIQHGGANTKARKKSTTTERKRKNKRGKRHR